MASNLFNIAFGAAKRIATRLFGGRNKTANLPPGAPLPPPVASAIGQAAAEALRDLAPPQATQAEIVQAIQQQIAPPPPRGPLAETARDEWPEEHDIKLLGRGDMGYYEPGQQELIEKEILTPQSSNVYSFVFQHETPRSGILYVTFKAWSPGQQGKSNKAGPTYAYYDVPTKVYHSFLRDSSGSPGGAVWDYLRVRGTTHDHKFQYRLTAGSTIPSGGVYVPRKATPKGFKKRSVPGFGTGKRDFTRSTLPERNFRGKKNTGRSNKRSIGGKL